MREMVVVLLAAVSLMACQETWKGVKKDTKTITKSIADAGNNLSKKIGDSLNSDEEKEGEE